MPSTASGIRSWCSNHKVLHEVTPLPNSAALHWIGPRSVSKSSNILVYVHGGGYNSALLAPGHVAFAVRCAIKASASLVMLEYSLSPGAKYPTQLRQIVAAVQILLQDTTAAKITLVGESAGSHLIAALLSHIMHPVDGVDSIEVSGRFAGVCFICPFVSFDYSQSSFIENIKRDYVTIEALKQVIIDFTPPLLQFKDAIKDPLISPAEAPQGWWTGVPVSRILVVYGAWEALKDGIITFGQKLEKDAGRETQIDIVQCAREVHAACIIDQMLGLKEREGDSTQTILAWMSAGRVEG